MRQLTILLTLITLTEVLGQEVEFVTKNDSLTIRGRNITNDPFRFGENSLSYLNKLNPKRTIELVENNHVQGKIDTVFRFFFGASKIVIYKIDNETTILTDVDLTTGDFKTRHGIQVGMKKHDVIKLLGYDNLSVAPKVIVLENLEFPEYLTFAFSNDILTKITFDGFID